MASADQTRLDRIIQSPDMMDYGESVLIVVHMAAYWGSTLFMFIYLFLQRSFCLPYIGHVTITTGYVIYYTCYLFFRQVPLCPWGELACP